MAIDWLPRQAFRIPLGRRLERPVRPRAPGAAVIRARWYTPPLRASGNGYGYAVLCEAMRNAAETAGLIVDDGAALAVYVMPPLRFEREPGARAVLFTMWESDDFPPELRPCVDDADLIIVPCSWNVEVFRRHLNPPVLPSPLGIDPILFRPIHRQHRVGDPFAWLWVGAPNGRKGPDVVESAWIAGGFDRRADCELYLKTTGNFDAEVAAEML